MKLLHIGDRIFNLEAVTHASFNPYATNAASSDAWDECCVSFGNDCQIFYGDEAIQVWKVLSHHSQCIPTPDEMAIAAKNPV